MERLDAVSPGEILEEEFLKPFGLSAFRLAKATRIPATRILEDRLSGDILRIRNSSIKAISPADRISLTIFSSA